MAVRNSIPCDGICSCSLDGQTKTGENNQKILQEYLKWIVKLNLSVKLLCDSVNRNFYKTRIHLRSSWETNGFKMLQMNQLSHLVCFCSLEITEFRKHPKKDIAARKHSIKQVSLYVRFFNRSAYQTYWRQESHVHKVITQVTLLHVLMHKIWGKWWKLKWIQWPRRSIFQLDVNLKTGQMFTSMLGEAKDTLHFFL